MGVLEGQNLTFSFPLAVDEMVTVRFWVKLPELSGPVILQAMVSAGEGSQSITVLAEVVLSVSAAEGLDDIRVWLDELVRAGHPDANRLSRASGFVGKALANPEPAKAIREVLQATDILIGLSDPSVVDLRVALGVWLRWAALRER